jgi:hypothetical protein
MSGKLYCLVPFLEYLVKYFKIVPNSDAAGILFSTLTLQEYVKTLSLS